MKTLKKIRAQKDYDFGNGHKMEKRDIATLESETEGGNVTFTFWNLKTATISEVDLKANFFEH